MVDLNAPPERQWSGVSVQVDDGTDDKPSFEQHSGMPQWAKLALIVAVIAVGVAIAVIG